MGYTTEFEGRIAVDPPLAKAEIEYLKKFAGTRHMDRSNGPYFVDGTGDFGQGTNWMGDPDVVDRNKPPAGQPGLWCQWVPTDDGKFIEWDGNEKFYNAEEWMTYIIDHFLAPRAKAIGYVPGVKGGHICSGKIVAQGEAVSDRWELIVRKNKVRVKALK